jgi:tetratricopeptide (TPR) repeat protein
MFKISRFAFLVAAATALVSPAAFAQPELPRPSPSAKVSQVIGLTEITVDYSSPAVKGRPIWGALVPYDQMWRTGANQATKITFSRDVTFGDKPVPAGTYALFTIPAKGAWTVILNKKADQAGTARDYKADLDLVRFQAHAKSAAHRERMMFLFSDFTDDKGTLELEWDKLRVSIPIKVNTEAQALANITKGIDSAWRTYANAARYLAETKKDYDTALTYIDQSINLKEDWFNLWIKATILAGKGKTADAIGMGQKAYELGQKAEYFFLEPEIKKTLATWKKKG